jgi:hypothetical protein
MSTLIWTKSHVRQQTVQGTDLADYALAGVLSSPPPRRHG